MYICIDYKVQCTSPSVNSLDCRHFWQIIYFLFQIFNYIHVQMTCFILYCYTCMVVNMLVVTTDKVDTCIVDWCMLYGRFVPPKNLGFVAYSRISSIISIMFIASNHQANILDHMQKTFTL